MSEDYGISPSRTACLLDTFSCIFQGIIPYGAQMLVAISAAAEMGFALSAFSIMRYLFYPYLLLVSSLVAIFLVKGKKNVSRQKRRHLAALLPFLRLKACESGNSVL